MFKKPWKAGDKIPRQIVIPDKYNVVMCEYQHQHFLINPEWLKWHRENKGVSLRALAKRARISAATLCLAEQGSDKQRITARVLKAYESVLPRHL